MTEQLKSSAIGNGPLLTFIIPVRHPDNAADWDELTAKLLQTAQSISRQTLRDWEAVVVANEEAVIPELPTGFRVKRVDFAPNPLHDADPRLQDQIYDMVRLDKGRRVLAGMLDALGSAYMMVVDDDDFVSRDLVHFVDRNKGEPGWFINRGLVWEDGTGLMIVHYEFDEYCGTSHIIRADLLNLPDNFAAADIDTVKSMFGSHRQIKRILAQRGAPLKALPFEGAVYRIGHAGAHSKSRGILRTFLFSKGHIWRPHRFLRNLRNLRLVTQAYKAQFGVRL